MTAFSFESGFFILIDIISFVFLFSCVTFEDIIIIFLETSNFHFVHFVSATVDFQKETEVEI